MSESLFSYLILGDSYFIVEMTVGGASTSYDNENNSPPPIPLPAVWTPFSLKHQRHTRYHVISFNLQCNLSCYSYMSTLMFVRYWWGVSDIYLLGLAIGVHEKMHLRVLQTVNIYINSRWFYSGQFKETHPNWSSCNNICLIVQLHPTSRILLIW